MMITILITSVATHATVGIPLHNAISYLAKFAPQLISGVFIDYMGHFDLQRSHEYIIVA